jgi:hypothetical protein
VTAVWRPSLDRRAVIVFAALVALLLAPWPRWSRLFGAAFCVYGNALVTGMHVADAAPPRFTVPPPGEIAAEDGGEWAVVLTAADRSFPLDTRIIGYTPLAIFLALTLATPAPRRRKAIIVVGGLVVLLARLAFAILVPVEHAFGGAPARGASASLGEIAWTVLITPPVMSYAAPAAVWWIALALTTPRVTSSGVPSTAKRRRANRRR